MSVIFFARFQPYETAHLPYEFKVGDFANPVTPRRVSWMKYIGGPLINTGLRALAPYDYLCDAGGGCFGLRPRKTGSGATH